MFLSLLKGGHGAPSVVGAACGAPCSIPWPTPTCHLLLAACCLLLAACYLPLATCYLLLTTHCSLLTTGTAGYWGLVALNVPVLGYLTRLAGHYLLKRHQRLMIMGYEYAEGDVAWDSDKVNRYPMIVAVGAIAAGMLGVGGGMILGPIFLELGIIPQVSPAAPSPAALNPAPNPKLQPQP